MVLNASAIFDGLNDSQKKAATAIDGPVLIVAGPGTGKTLTIVRRIAWLIHQGVKPEHILAVTFTNRAAREMKERTAGLLGNSAAKVFIGTFHLLGLRIIKDNRGDGVAIYSRDEQVRILKTVMKDPAKKAQQVAERISRIKNFLEDADDDTRAIYSAYQAALRQHNAFDVDDLIRTPVEMLENDEDGRTYRDRFKHIIVDEYQDINPVQYRLLRLLTGSAAAVCAVGDSDQAIYAFRGADLGNFLNFEKDFPGTTRITLSENYRSTKVIVTAAGKVVGYNQKRIDKELSASREQGAKVTLISVPDERTEGKAIIQEIEDRIGGTSHSQMRHTGSGRGSSGRSFRFSDFAVIFRTNAQARALEEAFSTSGIPYQLIGRRSSAQSKEIEETLAYLRSFLHEGGIAEPGPEHDQEAKLLTADDFFDPRADAVTLMTMHRAKGLEFRVVFIAGCEGGLVPCTIMKDVDIEEERRLFYVGMTRAKDELFLTSARNRFLYGQRLEQAPSPFLAEMPDEFKERRTVADKVKKQKPEEKQMGLF